MFEYERIDAALAYKFDPVTGRDTKHQQFSLH